MTRLNVEARFRRAVHLAVLGCLAAAPVAAGRETPQPGFIPQTGTRLSNAGTAGALPLTVITREEIDASGHSSLADLLRGLSINSFGSFRPQSGSSAQGLAALSLRGLGSERTLILIDGRRAPQAPFAPAAQDLNAIPLGAVERIEVLREGGSAIYGSGAIAGVVNIILRKDFQGTEFMHGRGYSDTGGGDTSQAGFLMGMPAGNGNIVIGASYNTRDIVLGSDLVAAGVDESRASIFSNNYVTRVDSFGTLSAVPGGCGASSAFFLADGSAFGSVVDEDGDGTPDVCRYDTNQVAADEAASDTMGLFAKGRFGLTDRWSAYATAMVSRATSFGRTAPAPSTLFVPGAVSGIDHDGDGTDDTVYVYHRYDALGSRDDTVDGEIYDLAAGFEGTAAGLALDFGARFNEYKGLQLGRNYVVNEIASALATSGDYDFRDPLANAPATLNQMKATISRDMRWRSRQWWASGAREAFALPGGAARLRLGVDHETVDYADQYDSLSEGGAVSGSAGNSAQGRRDGTGYFAELGLPLLPRLHAGAALRHDDVSDIAGRTSSRVTASYDVSPWLGVRAGWNTGFRAPQLDALDMLPSTSSETLCDPVTGICAPVQVVTIANPDLDGEKSGQYSVGIRLKPAATFSVALDYYDLTIDDAVTFVTWSRLLEIQARGGRLPPGLSVTRDPAQGNRVVSVVAGYANYGGVRTQGLDLALDGGWSVGAAGRVTSRLQASTIFGYEYSLDGEDLVGKQGAPQWRANWNTAWRSGPLSMAWNQLALAGHDEPAFFGGNADVWWTHDLQVNYDLPFNAGMLAVGALNVTNEMPPGYDYDGRPFNFYLYNAYGRTPYVRYTLTFN